MKILMTSVHFYPRIGGIISVTDFLAKEFIRKGHDVIVVTATESEDKMDVPYTLLRCPSLVSFWESYKWCDVFVHQGISLYWIWPVLLKRKTWFVVYHQTYTAGGGFKSRIKRFLAMHDFSYNIAVSNIVAKGQRLSNPIVIHNSFNDQIFKNYDRKHRKNFVYVGKLWKSKGVFLLVDAFDEFKDITDCDWNLYMIGGGDKNDEFSEYVRKKKHVQSIYLLGEKKPEEIVDVLNDCCVQIVPSLDEEAFGLVALEGMACGCVVIGADKSGITEAMGEAGIQFERGNKESLINALTKSINMKPDEYEHMKMVSINRTETLSLSNVADKYLYEFSRRLNVAHN